MESDLAKKTVDSNPNSTERVKDFTWDIRDVRSNCKDGLRVQKGRKHPGIEQLEGFHYPEEDAGNGYKTIRNWNDGWIGTTYQSFLDVDIIIETSKLKLLEKDKDKISLSKSRKRAVGTRFKIYLPWSTSTKTHVPGTNWQQHGVQAL